MEPPVRVYADTSVFGGVFDVQFEAASKAFFDLVRRKRLTLVISELVLEELIPAPPQVRRWFERHQPIAEQVKVGESALELRQAYLEAGIVSPASRADALHVALATVTACPVLISWNCKHIVHFRRIRQYNAVNQFKGYGTVSIHTPLEVIGDAQEEI